MTRQEFNHQIAQYKHTVRSGSGIVTLGSGIKCVAPSVKFYGACQQDGTPTPEVPVEVKCNNSKWVASGKNILQRQDSGGWGVGNVRGYGSSGGVPYFSCHIPVGESYTISLDLKKGSQDSLGLFGIWGRSADGTTLFGGSAGYRPFYGKGIILSDEYQRFSITLRNTYDVPIAELRFGYYNSGQFLKYNTNTPMVSLGDAALPYEPYHDGGSVDLSLLPDGGLYGINDVRDEWDAVTGKGVKKIRKLVWGKDMTGGTANAFPSNSCSFWPTVSGEWGTRFSATAKPLIFFEKSTEAIDRKISLSIYRDYLYLSVNNDLSGAIQGEDDVYAARDKCVRWLNQKAQEGNPLIIVYQITEPVPFTATPQPIIEQNGYNQLLQESGDIADTDAEVTFVQHS